MPLCPQCFFIIQWPLRHLPLLIVLVSLPVLNIGSWLPRSILSVALAMVTCSLICQVSLLNVLVNPGRQLPSHSTFTGGKRVYNQWIHCDLIVIFKQFTQPETSGYMLSFFKMYSPLWSECKQWIHADHFYKENTKVTSGYFLNENSEIFHNYDQNVSSGYSLKETPGFFHNFVYNVTIRGLSHSLRVISKYIQECNQNVPSSFFSK